MRIIELPPAPARQRHGWRDYLVAVLIFAGLLAAAVVVSLAAQIWLGAA